MMKVSLGIKLQIQAHPLLYPGTDLPCTSEANGADNH